MVLTGPMAEITATLLDPIRFIPAEIRKLGSTVATTASSKPYHQWCMACWMAGASPARAKCVNTPAVADSMAQAVKRAAPTVGIMRPLPAMYTAKVMEHKKISKLPHKNPGWCTSTCISPNIGNGNAGIGKPQGNGLHATYRLPEYKSIDQHCKSGVEEEDQSLQSGRHILQSFKIEPTAQVITKQSQEMMYSHCLAVSGRVFCRFVASQAAAT